MKGVITLCLKELVQEKYSADKWQEIIAKAGYDKDPIIFPISDVEDRILFDLAAAASEVLNINKAQMFEMMGIHWVTVYSQRLYQAYYESSHSARELLSQMDRIHVSVTKNVRGATPPRFEYEWESERSLVMTYQSNRYMIDYLVGTVKGVGQLFNERLVVTKLDDTKVRIVFS